MYAISLFILVDVSEKQLCKKGLSLHIALYNTFIRIHRPIYSEFAYNLAILLACPSHHTLLSPVKLRLVKRCSGCLLYYHLQGAGTPLLVT